MTDFNESVNGRDIRPKSVNTKESFTEKVDVTASPTGDTIQEALSNAPVHGSRTGLFLIDIASGTYANGVELGDFTTGPTVELQGTKDGSGNPDSTINGRMYAAFGNEFLMSNLRIDISDSYAYPIYLTDGGEALTTNCEVIGNGANQLVAVWNGARAELKNTTVTNNDSGAVACINVIRGGVRVENTTVEMTGSDDTGVSATDHSWIHLEDATIDGGGSNYELVEGFKNSTLEAKNTTFQNGEVGITANVDTFLNIKADCTFNTTEAYDWDPGCSIQDEGTTYGFTYMSNGWLRNQDLSAAGAETCTKPDKHPMCFHTGNNPGLYRADPANSQWVKIEDNSATIAY